LSILEQPSVIASDVTSIMEWVNVKEIN